MRFLFTYKLQGEGDTEEQALVDAMEAFMLDPGEPSETELVEVEYVTYDGRDSDE